jgi:hypothetical protein
MTQNQKFIPGAGKIPQMFNEEAGEDFMADKKGFPDPNFGLEQWANHRNTDSASDEQ